MRVLTDKDLGRSLEVLQATAARRGPITINVNDATALLGRLCSIAVSGGTLATHPDMGLGARTTGSSHVALALSLIDLLGYKPADVEPIVRAIHADLREVLP